MTIQNGVLPRQPRVADLDIGQAAARAVSQQVQVAEHTLRRHRVQPPMQDGTTWPSRPLSLLRMSKILIYRSSCLRH
jgi:hypothetical protein